MGYDGTQSLCDYLKQLERCTVVSGWSREEAASFFLLQAFEEKRMSGSDCRKYTKIVGKSELWFGAEKQCESHQVCLSNCRQLENRSVQALAADIRSMSSLAYQDLSLDTQKDLLSSTLLMH